MHTIDRLVCGFLVVKQDTYSGYRSTGTQRPDTNSRIDRFYNQHWERMQPVQQRPSRPAGMHMPAVASAAKPINTITKDVGGWDKNTSNTRKWVGGKQNVNPKPSKHAAQHPMGANQGTTHARHTIPPHGKSAMKQ